MHHLREVRDDDHEFMVELHNDPVVLYNLTDPRPITMESHMKWWGIVKDNPRERRFIFDVDGQRAGLTKFYAIDKANNNCVLGADLHQAFRGKRLATPMWTLMLDMAFYKLDLHRVSLTTAEYNEVARRVYYGLGFGTEGVLNQSLYRDGKYRDQFLMYMTRPMWMEHGTR